MCSNECAVCLRLNRYARAPFQLDRVGGWGRGVFVKRPEISGTAGDWPIMSGADDAKNGPFRKD